MMPIRSLLVGAVTVHHMRGMFGGAAGEAEPPDLPVTMAGYAGTVATGLVLFAWRATDYADNAAFWANLGLLALRSPISL